METFMKVYKEELSGAVESFPNEYCYKKEDVPAVAARMYEAIKNGTFNKDSRAIKATCKELGIKHTYKDIARFIANHK